MHGSSAYEAITRLTTWKDTRQQYHDHTIWAPYTYTDTNLWRIEVKIQRGDLKLVLYDSQLNLEVIFTLNMAKAI